METYGHLWVSRYLKRIYIHSPCVNFTVHMYRDMSICPTHTHIYICTHIKNYPILICTTNITYLQKNSLQIIAYYPSNYILMANMSPGVNHPNTSRCAGGSVWCCTIYIYVIYTLPSCPSFCMMHVLPINAMSWPVQHLLFQFWILEGTWTDQNKFP
jgi:hypothetical protein